MDPGRAHCPHTLQVGDRDTQPLQSLRGWLTTPGSSSGLPRTALTQQVREPVWACLAAESVCSDHVLQDWEKQLWAGVTGPAGLLCDCVWQT